MTLVCVPIMVRDAESGLAAARAARDGGADLVEFRVDEFFDGEAVSIGGVLDLVAGSALPCIVTCRPAWEGGGYDGDEAARIALFERLGTAFGEGEHPPRFIDVELAAMERSANLRQKVRLAVDHPEQLRDLRTSLIVSTHDFDGRPSDLSRRLLRMAQEPAAAVAKIAYRARSLRDNLELFDLLASRERPMIALGMGEFGLMSRVLARKFGGFLTFAGLSAASATAPGQPALRELLGLYRFRSIRATTRVYGVVGWPLGHSLSPLVHNAGFDEVGFDGVYLPLPVAAGEGGAGAYESLKATLGELIDHPRLDFCGCSVTIPHKAALLRLARESGWEVDGIAERVGAGNTLHVEREGGRAARVRVSNTDAAAAVDSLRRELGDLEGARVVVIGAGGVARAVIVGLVEARATVVIASRRRGGAEAVAAELRARLNVGESRIGVVDLNDECTGGCAALVNCTPLGMTGGPDPGASPVDAGRLAGTRAVVMDTVYNPPETPLLRASRAAGLRTVDGVGMFVRQAEAQFEGWTGSPAPAGLFDRVVRAAIGRGEPR